ncbi:unnamed protein product [Prorocentrum cordatum]|uniref:Uncharacterized protein n=1 Tax=Prorocentrum cordatum TaxID=2364126 RepID=A0ABN9QNI1_9DINO|nr:unnamed protein product [Polarella glacialis]
MPRLKSMGKSHLSHGSRGHEDSVQARLHASTCRSPVHVRLLKCIVENHATKVNGTGGRPGEIQWDPRWNEMEEQQTADGMRAHAQQLLRGSGKDARQDAFDKKFYVMPRPAVPALLGLPLTRLELLAAGRGGGRRGGRFDTSPEHCSTH